MFHMEWSHTSTQLKACETGAASVITDDARVLVREMDVEDEVRRLKFC